MSNWQSVLSGEFLQNSSSERQAEPVAKTPPPIKLKQNNDCTAPCVSAGLSHLEFCLELKASLNCFKSSDLIRRHVIKALHRLCSANRGPLERSPCVMRTLDNSERTATSALRRRNLRQVYVAGLFTHNYASSGSHGCTVIS